MLFGKNKSLVCFSPNPRAAVRLFCFPCAGGGASMYRRWATLLPGVDVWAVNYPGRETLHGQPFAPSLDAVLAPVLEQQELFAEKPFLVYGHSFGSLVAFAAAVRLQALGCQTRGVLGSARRAPHLPTGQVISDLPDDRFLAELDRFGGMPDAIRKDPEMLAFYLPIIRADLHLNDISRLPDTDRIDAPVYVFSGSHDRVATQAELLAWKNSSTGRVEHREFTGGHFFIQDKAEEFTACIGNVIGTIMQEPDEDLVAF
ncbi:MAG TPA: alpha/beta fold hydrolase [Candidatus Kapabacteria bacterium]|nr:alpha/beta fold hydrolase [Candidatus Kapabacteria bacterium]